jgi:hypothetical protein
MIRLQPEGRRLRLRPTRADPMGHEDEDIVDIDLHSRVNEE